MTESIAQTLAVQRCVELLKLCTDEARLKLPAHYSERVASRVAGEMGLVLALERLMMAAGPSEYALPSVAKMIVSMGRADQMPSDAIFEAMSNCLTDALVARHQAEEAAREKQRRLDAAKGKGGA